MGTKSKMQEVMAYYAEDHIERRIGNLLGNRKAVR